MNREELRETYKKFNDEITKAQTPEDKNKILDTIFPEHGKHATELALSTKEIAKLSAKKDEARNACSNNEMMQYNIERINDDVERLTEQFPELAGEIRRYADATICSAVTGKKNEVQKPAKKLPMWKKQLSQLPNYLAANTMLWIMLPRLLTSGVKNLVPIRPKMIFLHI